MFRTSLSAVVFAALMSLASLAQAQTTPAPAAVPSAKPAASTAAAPAAVPAAKATSVRCRDSKGHYAKCPTATAAAPAKKGCRDAKGRFIACAK